MLKAYSKFLDAVEKVVKVLIVIMTVIMLGSMTYQVIMRYFFSKGNAWSEELARLMCIWVVMLGAAIATRIYAHLQIDVLINLAPPRPRHLVVALVTLVGALFMVVMLKYSIALCTGTGTSTSAGLGISKKYIYACMPVGFALMILTSLEVIWKNIVDFIHFDASDGQEDNT